MQQTRSVHKYTHDQQMKNFEKLNYEGRPCGKVPKTINKLVSTADSKAIKMHFDSNYVVPHIRGGILFSYLEDNFWTVTPEVLHAIIDVEPRLVCKDLAVPLLNSNNIPALLALEERGYEIDQHFIEEFKASIEGAYESESTKRIELNRYYTPLIQFLKDRGFNLELP